MGKTKRAAHIVAVLIRHGFADIIDRTGIGALVEGGLEKLGKKHDPDHQHHLPVAVRLRRVLEELGSTFIKLGQILSTRPDLVPPEIAEEFSKLQSDTPKADFAKIRERLEEACPDGVDKVFHEVDETPLASASIAQVHRATLVDGTPAVVKVLRPGVEQTVKGDIAILRDLAALAEPLHERFGLSPKEVVEEFARTMEIELDLRREAASIEKLNGLFADEPAISFPKVYHRATSRAVLAMEEIQGVQLSRPEARELGVAQRRAACGNGAMAVFRMCLEFGFFHADPHPGNIFVTEGGGVVFIDCGMTGHVEERVRFQLGRFVRGVLERDLDHTIRSAIEISDADPSLADDRHFRRDVWEMITRFETDSVSGLDLPALLEHLFGLLRKFKIRCPADLVYLIKALATVEGVAEMVDPEFDVIEHVRPLMKKLVSKRYGLRALKDRFARTAEGYIEVLEDLPDEIRSFAHKLRRDKYEVSLRHRGVDELRDSVLNAGRFIAMAMVLAATLISSAIVLLSEASRAERSPFGKISQIAFVVSLVFVVIMAVAAWRHRSKH